MPNGPVGWLVPFITTSVVDEGSPRDIVPIPALSPPIKNVGSNDMVKTPPYGVKSIISESSTEKSVARVPGRYPIIILLDISEYVDIVDS